jgi:hypothetical protein
MKYLVATQYGQGSRENDFFWANEGEPLHFGVECDREDIDGPCGCKRSLCGVDSAKATTTFRVAEVDACQTINRLRDHFVRNWYMDEHEARQEAEEQSLEIAMLARQYEVGQMLERRENGIQPR